MLTIFGSRLTMFDLIRHIRDVGDSLPQPGAPLQNVRETLRDTKKQRGLSGARCLVEP